MKYLITLSLSLIVFASCQKNKEEWKTSKTGLQYIIHQHKANAVKPKKGDVLVLNLEYYTEDDSLLFSSKELNTPFRMKLKKNQAKDATIDDALAMLYIGDSASFKINANLFYTLTKRQKAPQWVKMNDKLIFHIRVKKLFDYSSYIKKKEFEKHTPSYEKQELKKYIEITNTQVQPQSSGLYFITKTEGNGLQAEYGDSVWVHYIGTFLSGKPFSNSYKIGYPFAFVLGNDDLIKGFAEGVSMMRENENAQLIIPSDLAYGSEGNQVIPPYSTLVFNIEVLKIKKNN